MLITRERMNQEALLNRDPLNQACRALLPPDWRSPPGLDCLNLLLWALENLRYTITSPAYGYPDEIDVEDQVAALLKGNPAWAMEWLTVMPGTEGDEAFGPGDLAQAENLEEAAAMLLEHVCQQILEHR